jgi:CarD family transcriptional regulator
MFKVGDVAVYPAHGVGVVQAIENKQFAGDTREFYVLKILDNGMTIMIPKDNVKNVGLRGVISRSMIPKVFDILREKKEVPDSQTWNRRFREYSEKIKTGSVFEIAEVLRDLLILRQKKTLSFGERRMLDTARNLLIKELAIAKRANEKTIEAEISGIFES